MQAVWSAEAVAWGKRGVSLAAAAEVSSADSCFPAARAPKSFSFSALHFAIMSW